MCIYTLHTCICLISSIPGGEKASKRSRPSLDSDGSVVQESKKKKKHKERGPVPIKRKASSFGFTT